MTATAPESVTFWLRRWQEGDECAPEQVVRLVYQDLRRLAASYLRSEDPSHTLQATALVHELYLRISSAEDMDYKSRGHFMAVAAQMMRRILIDHARRRVAARSAMAPINRPPGIGGLPELLDINQALDRLGAGYPRHAKIVELRFFGGFDGPEIAQTLGLSLRTVERDWQFAKAWLQHEVEQF